MSRNDGDVLVQDAVTEIERGFDTHLERVEAGEVVVITKSGQPFAQIRPLVPGTMPLRPYARCVGEFTVPDDFDAPLPEQVTQVVETRFS